jgi:hypothetical protein
MTETPEAEDGREQAAGIGERQERLPGTGDDDGESLAETENGERGPPPETEDNERESPAETGDGERESPAETGDGERESPAGTENGEREHLSELRDGCGCAEVWEHLSEHRGDDD